VVVTVEDSKVIVETKVDVEVSLDVTVEVSVIVWVVGVVASDITVWVEVGETIVKVDTEV